jgi:hopanoid biosynthesis associated protein HpnK
MTRERKVIVNADDFGLTPGINAGILDAHRDGILTSASVFANAPATAEAVAIAKRTPTLGIGCHLALVDGEPLSRLSTLPTLARDGRFRQTWGSLIADAVRGRVSLDEIERELELQIDRLVTSGVRVSHLDAHKHVHAYPPIFRIVVRLARRFGIARVRVPWERPAVALVLRHALERPQRRQALENLALSWWASEDRREAARAGMEAPHFFGRVLTGLFTLRSFTAMLAALPSGTTEVMVHPGYVDAALDRVRTRLRGERAEEVSLLTAAATREAVARAGLTLVTHDPLSEPHSHAS